MISNSEQLEITLFLCFYYFRKSILRIILDLVCTIPNIYKVRTGARYDVQNEGRVRGLIFVYLLMLIIHVTKHVSTRECARDDERGVPLSGLRAPESHRKDECASHACALLGKHLRISVCVSERACLLQYL